MIHGQDRPLIHVPMTPELHAYLKTNPWDFTGRVRMTLDPDNVLNVEIIHDCFLMRCVHHYEPEWHRRQGDGTSAGESMEP